MWHTGIVATILGHGRATNSAPGPTVLLALFGLGVLAPTSNLVTKKYELEATASLCMLTLSRECKLWQISDCLG